MDKKYFADLADRYLAYLMEVFQQEPLIFTNHTFTTGLPSVISFVFKDIPEKGFTSAFTYGLSLFPNENWLKGRPELSISVQSEDINWGIALGKIANFYRDHQSFSYGQAFDGEVQVSKDSEMTSFFIFAPSILDKEYYLGIDIGAIYKINIACLYPIYKEEIEMIHRIGLKDFMHHEGYDMYDVQRVNIAKELRN